MSFSHSLLSTLRLWDFNHQRNLSRKRRKRRGRRKTLTMAITGTTYREKIEGVNRKRRWRWKRGLTTRGTSDNSLLCRSILFDYEVIQVKDALPSLCSPMLHCSLFLWSSLVLWLSALKATGCLDEFFIWSSLISGSLLSNTKANPLDV